MRVLVTGASGFIGRYAVEELDRIGASVVAVSRAGRAPAGVEAVSADLLQPGVAAELMARVQPTHLLHLAWNATPGRFWTTSDNLDWCAASLNLVRAFYAVGGQRAVLAGSCAEYDWTQSAMLDEDEGDTAPATLYGIAKDALRRLMAGYAAQYRRSIAWGRIFWLYGPHEAPGRLVSDVAAALKAGRPAETSAGLQRRDFLHVADVAGAFVAALKTDFTGTFNICSGEPVAVRDLVSLLADAMGRPDLVRFGVRPTSPTEPPLLYGNVDALRHGMGFSPRLSLKDGLADTARWWKEAAI